MSFLFWIFVGVIVDPVVNAKNGNLKRKHKNKTFWTLTDLWKILKSGRHQMISNFFHLVLLPFVNWMKKLINSMMENMTCIIQLFLLDVSLNMLSTIH